MSVGGIAAAMRSALMIGFIVGGTLAPALAAQIDYTYDKMGRLISARYPNNTLVEYGYDAAGNRVQRRAESCVEAEDAPNAVNDTMTVYFGQWWDEETQQYWTYYYGDIDLLANDTDPTNYPLVVRWSAMEGTPGAGTYDVSFICEGFGCTVPPANFSYTISNQHCQTDTATVTINVVPAP